MSVKVVAVLVAVDAGERVNVASFCRENGVSRKTFYKWAARYRAEGMAGLEDRSTRPRSSPGQVPVDVEESIVLARKELCDAGLDHGATTIQWHLGRRPELKGKVPSVAGVHRVLVRRGLVVPQPKKRPKSSYRRFEAAAPNERWQIDAMDWTIAVGVVRVFNIIDDHSRVATRSRAVAEATTSEAWKTFEQAVTVWGCPAGVLSDNGLCFSGKLRGMEVAFEANLRDAGIKPMTGAPYHPQTTGKVERFQQTLKKWLRRQPLAGSLTDLQAQLDAFIEIYNRQRPHQCIQRQIPIERFRASAPAGPAAEALAHPRYATDRSEGTVAATGVVTTGRYDIHIGVEWAGQPATVLINGNHASVIVNGKLARYLEMNLDQRYQPSGRPRGGPRRQRLP